VLASIPTGSALAADATRTSRDSRHGTGNSGNGSAPNCPNLRGQTVPAHGTPGPPPPWLPGTTLDNTVGATRGANSQRPAGKQFQGTAFGGSDPFVGWAVGAGRSQCLATNVVGPIRRYFLTLCRLLRRGCHRG
jgi:hypothetical protein